MTTAGSPYPLGHDSAEDKAQDAHGNEVPLLVERIPDDSRIVLMTLNRPAARNAVDSSLAQALFRAIDDFDADPDLRVAVLTGAGKGFSAGMDLKAFASGDLPFLEDGGFAGFTRRPPHKPLVAAIEGFALAGGMEMALACDLIVAADNAVLGLPEVRRGLVAAAGGLLRLPHRIPWHVAAEVALTGQPMSAGRLHEVGLINRLTPPGGAVAAALTLASTIADNAPLAIEVSKKILTRAAEGGSDLTWEEHEILTRSVLESQDAREGSLAFAERRPPSWTGR
jgi:enoyl-CoA hydratase